MTVKVKYSHPHFPDGMLFGLYPLGELENNGAAVEVSEEQEQVFKDTNEGVGIEEAIANDAMLSVEGAAPKAKTSAAAPAKEEGSDK